MSSYGNGNGAENRVRVEDDGSHNGQNQKQKQQFVLPSLCIPRTHANIRRERIFAVLRSLNLGWVGRIDIVPKKNDEGTEYVRVFIHFTKWFNNHHTRKFLERLDADGHARIVYDEPWYWKVTKSTMPAPEEFKPKEPRAQPHSRYPKPRIDFDSNDKNGAVTRTTGTTAVDDAAAVVHRIVPVQVTRVTRHAKSVSGGGSVSVSVSGSDDKKGKYWKEQAHLAMKSIQQPCENLSPTPKLGDSVSPCVQGKSLSVKLFE